MRKNDRRQTYTYSEILLENHIIMGFQLVPISMILYDPEWP